MYSTSRGPRVFFSCAHVRACVKYGVPGFVGSEVLRPLRHLGRLPSLKDGSRHSSSQPRSIIVSSLAISRRHASSHKRPASSSSSSASSSHVLSESYRDDVNPPASTLPADLDLPDPLPASASPAQKLYRYVAVGRAYVSFYKTGLKNVYNNYKESKPLRKSVQLNRYSLFSIPPPSPRAKSPSASSPFESAVELAGLTRSEVQLMRRASYDMCRLIPFAFILLFCGEFTPVVVLALGSAVTPFTCRVPGQIAKLQRQKASGKRAALAAHQVTAVGSVAPPSVGSDPELALLVGKYANREWVEAASGEEVLQACAVFGLTKTHLLPAALGTLVYRQRLRRHVEYLQLDDRLIMKGGGVKFMKAVEVEIAVGERGGVDVAAGEKGAAGERARRTWLERWLQWRRKG